jgi:peptidoglycan/xylan/chitin deacetylase (PgdA/CDA1 family)
MGTPRRSTDPVVATALPVLMYHGIHDDDRDPGIYNPLYSLTAGAFAGHLDWLADQGFRTRLLADPKRTPRDVVITFDDGDASAAAVAMPMLLARGMVAEFCITSDFVGRPGSVTREDLRALIANGMGVQSHGRTHRPLSTLTDGELAEELVRSRRDLEEWSGTPVVGLSVPGGRAGAREERFARDAGYRILMNSVPGPNRRMRPNGYLNRLAMTRTVSLEEFAQLVLWRGVAARRLVLRTAALEVPKRVLGDVRYDRLRDRVLSR